MTLIELYNLKINEYKKTGQREKPCKLLAMLLLSEKDKYEPLRSSQGKFYKKYKKIIDDKIKKVEKDFNFSYEDIVEFIEKTVICNKYKEQKIWFVYAEGFGALNWGLIYNPDKTGEEIYTEYFDTDDLNKKYDIEEKAKNNNINITELDKLIDRILDNPNEFYKRICDELTPEERLFILNEIENKNCMNCTNGSCRVEYKEKIGTDESGKPQGYMCAGWFNAEIIGKTKVLRKK